MHSKCIIISCFQITLLHIQQKQIKILMSLQTQTVQQPQKIFYGHAKTSIQWEETASTRRISTQNLLGREIQHHNQTSNQFASIRLPSISVKQNKIVAFSLDLKHQVQRQIQQQISIGKITVSLNKSNYPICYQRNKTKIKNNQNDSIQQKLLETQRKKQQTLHLLRLLHNQEMEIKKLKSSLKLNKLLQQNNSPKKQRSYFSPEQRKEVKKMLQRKQKLQEKLNEKTQNALKNYRQKTQTQNQKHEQQIKKQKQLHRQYVELNRKQAANRRLERLKLIESGNKKVQQLKSRQYWYQMLQVQDIQQTLQKNQETRNKLNLIKLKVKISTAEEIKQHRQKYEKMMKSKIEERNSLRMGDPGTQKSKNGCLKRRIQQNYFTKLVRNELQVRRQEQAQAKRQPYFFKQKVRTFSQHCKTGIRPKLKVTQESKFNPRKKNHSVNSLDYFQQRSKGNQYLSIARKLKRCETLEEDKVLESKTADRTPQKMPRVQYRNYLIQMRRSSQDNPQSTRKRFSEFLQKQGKISQFDSLHQAVVLAEGMQALSKKSINEKLLDSVRNKINLLNMVI